MTLVFVAYYHSMFFFKICSEGGDLPLIIEIALSFYLQLSKLGWPNSGQIGPNLFISVGFDELRFCLSARLYVLPNHPAV